MMEHLAGRATLVSLLAVVGFGGLLACATSSDGPPSSSGGPPAPTEPAARAEASSGQEEGNAQPPDRDRSGPGAPPPPDAASAAEAPPDDGASAGTGSAPPSTMGDALEAATADLKAALPRCEVQQGQPGQPSEGATLAVCGDGELFAVAVTEQSQHPLFRNSDLLLQAMLKEVKDLPPPRMEKLDLPGGTKLDVIVIESPADDEEDAHVYLAERGLRPGLKLALCGWKNVDDHAERCRDLLHRLTR